jgi:hypothetical protein
MTANKLLKHIKIAFFVGTILNLISQFEAIIILNFGEINILKAIITFVVPFSVSIYSAATIGRQR